MFADDVRLKQTSASSNRSGPELPKTHPG